MSSEDTIESLLKRISKRNKLIKELSSHKDAAYRERDALVAVLSKLALREGGDAWLTKHEGEDWDDDWRNIVVIVLDGRQLTWHISDEEVSMFNHLQGREVKAPWDGHSTEEKYERLASIGIFSIATEPCIPSCRAAGPVTHTPGCHNSKKWPIGIKPF